jgi:hypothetical protein
MKLLVILGADETCQIITHYVKPLGFDIIRYNHAVKAMDNISEIDPVGVILSARDYPRHWKVLVQFIRSTKPKEVCPIVLLTGNGFSIEDTSKALYLGVSGLVPEVLKAPSEIGRLQDILSRYIPVEERRKFRRSFIEPWQRCGLLFVNPIKKVLVSGEVKTLSIGGGSFVPSHHALLEDLLLDTDLPDCSLRIGDEILSPKCRLIRTGRIIALKFISFPGGEQALLNSYLEKPPKGFSKGDYSAGYGGPQVR